MRIALVAYLHGAGGAERQIVMLANELAERGHDIHLISLVDYNKKYIISDQVQIHDLSFRETIKVKGPKQVQRFFLLKKELSKISPDVSIHFWLQSAKFATAMNKKNVGKVIYAERGDPGDSEYNGLSGMLRTLSFKRIDGFVFQTRAARDYFDQSIVDRSIVISNSVSVPDHIYKSPCTNRRKVIVNVGRLHEQKNQKLLISAFSKLSDEFSEYSLEIYGEGTLQAELENYIKLLGLGERIKLCGNKTNIFDYVYDSSLFVLTSNYEGMPNALMEAMAIGVPTISTDCKPGGAREIITDSFDGVITPIENVDSLVKAMEWLLSDRDKAESMAAEAMHIRERYSHKTIFDRWESFILSVIR